MTIPTKPTDSAEWATTEQVNPVSGQSNIVEPPGSQVEFGWTYLQKPPRQYFNWWQNVVGRWVEWLEYRATREPVQPAAGTAGVTLTSDDENIQVFTPSAAITVKLDNSFSSGVSLTIVNNGTARITVNANDDALIAYVNPSQSIVFKALTDAPGTPIVWSSVGYYVPPTCSAYLSADMTGIVDNVLTIVTFNAEQFDVGSIFNTATNRIAPTVPGKYLITWGIIAGTSFLADEILSLETWLYKNTGEAHPGSAVYATVTTFAGVISTGSAVVDANGTTDYFQIRATMNTDGTAWNILGGATESFVTACKIG